MYVSISGRKSVRFLENFACVVNECPYLESPEKQQSLKNFKINFQLDFSELSAYFMKRYKINFKHHYFFCLFVFLPLNCRERDGFSDLRIRPQGHRT